MLHTQIGNFTPVQYGHTGKEVALEQEPRRNLEDDTAVDAIVTPPQDIRCFRAASDEDTFFPIDTRWEDYRSGGAIVAHVGHDMIRKSGRGSCSDTGLEQSGDGSGHMRWHSCRIQTSNIVRDRNTLYAFAETQNE